VLLFLVVLMLIVLRVLLARWAVSGDHPKKKLTARGAYIPRPSDCSDCHPDTLATNTYLYNYFWSVVLGRS
jgi:hypothetical protein